MTTFYHVSAFWISVADIPELHHHLPVGSQNTNCHIHLYLQKPDIIVNAIPVSSDRTGSARGYQPPYLGRLMQYTCIKFPTVRCRLQAPTAQLPDQTDTNRAPLSCDITNPHLKSYVVSNWSNHFHSKVFSKLLMTAKIGPQPSWGRCPNTHHRTVDPFTQ